ncbi:MAG TPA: tetratricopeptide repeat protein [Gemmatimonadales bacterium]|nr:tetratricopeptide repeat protein [Gemmatimonadales bacterium]
MRKLTLIPCVLTAIALAACGDKHAKSGDANAAEAPMPAATPESSSGSTTTAAVPTGPVSFEDAKTAYTGRRYDEAVRLFTAYTSQKPDNVWGYYMLGLSSWKSGDRDQAVSAFRQAIEKDSTHIKSRINLSRVLLEQGKAQDALPEVEASLQLDSSSAEGYRLLGRVKDELGDPVAASEAFKRAIVLDPRDAWSMNNLGRVAIGQLNYVEALAPLARAVEIDSSVATFQNNLGFALEHTGHFTQAVSAYRAALASDSSYKKASVNLARVEKLTQDSTVAPVDLSVLARTFVEQVTTKN